LGRLLHVCGAAGYIAASRLIIVKSIFMYHEDAQWRPSIPRFIRGASSKLEELELKFKLYSKSKVKGSFLDSERQLAFVFACGLY
jgi:hypothetical protein